MVTPWVDGLVAWTGGVILMAVGLWKNRHLLSLAAWGAGRELVLTGRMARATYRKMRKGEQVPPELLTDIETWEVGRNIFTVLILFFFPVISGVVFAVIVKPFLHVSLGWVPVLIVWGVLLRTIWKGGGSAGRITEAIRKELTRDAIRK